MVLAGTLVKFAPLAAGNAAGNLASGIVPDVKLAALNAVKSFAVLAALAVLIAFAILSSVTASSAIPLVFNCVNAISQPPLVCFPWLPKRGTLGNWCLLR